MLSSRERALILGELSFWLALAGAAYALTFEFSGETGTYAWGAASWPRAILLLMVLAAVVHAAARVKSLRAQSTDAARRWRLRPGEGLDPRRAILLAGILALPLAYLLLLPRAGFYVTTPFFLALYLLLLGETRWAYLVGVPLLIYALINLIFTKLFFVALPLGTWPGFYEVSNWFLVAVR